MWNELPFFCNELTILWNDLPIDWNDLTMEWNDHNLPPCDLVYFFFVTIFSVFFSLWPVVRTCNLAVCQQVEGHEHLRSSCLRIESKWPGKPFQMAPAHQLCILEGWFVLGDRYSPRKGACFLPLHITSAQHWHKDYQAAKLSKNSLALQAQFVFGTIYNVWKGRGKQEAKFKD